MNVFLRGNRDFCKSADRHELASLGIDDETADSDILWNQRMVADRIDGLTHRILYCIKACEPFFKIDATVFHQVDRFLRNAAILHMVDHHFAVDVLHATVGVTDDQDLGDTQLNDTDEQAADHASERIRHDTARF